VQENVPFKKEAQALGIDARFRRDLNSQRLKGLQLSSNLKKDTYLQIRSLDDLPPEIAAAEPPQLFNRVVRIDGEDDYVYWYVLTYLPDLQWCHVAPLEQRGIFTSKPAPCGHVGEGRTRWMLVSESEGGEIDVGAGRCHMMEAYEMMGTKANADKEEWDVVGLAPAGWEGPASISSGNKGKKKAKAPSSGTPVGEQPAPTPPAPAPTAAILACATPTAVVEPDDAAVAKPDDAAVAKPDDATDATSATTAGDAIAVAGDALEASTQPEAVSQEL